jgi:hypothetical protein
LQQSLKRKFDTKTVGTNGFETREGTCNYWEQYPSNISNSVYPGS